MRARTSTCIIYCRTRGTWHLKGYASDGTPVRKKLGTIRDLPTRADAERAAQPFRKMLRKPTLSVPTVRELAEQFAAEKMVMTRMSTARSNQAWLRNHVLPKFGETPIDKLQARPVELWLRELPLSPKSRVHIRNLLHALVDFAQWAGVIETARNPMELVTVKGASKRTRKPRSLTVEEFRLFVAHLDEPFRTIAVVSVSFGLRISEALGLKWRDIDWLGAKLSIERGVVRGVVDAVKTEYSGRTVAIDAAVLEILKGWKQTSQFTAPDDWIFASPVQLGRLPWSYPHVLRRFNRAGNAAGIGGVSPHVMRHTYRAWLDATGTSVAVQQKMMRHASITTTMNLYGDVVTNEMEQAQARVAELVLSRN